MLVLIANPDSHTKSKSLTHGTIVIECRCGQNVIAEINA